MGVSVEQYLCLGAFLELFTLLEYRQGKSPRSLMERLVTLQLTKQPLLLICLAKPESHTKIHWGAQYVTPSFTCATPEDGTFLVFARDVCLGHHPKIVEVKAGWPTIRNVATPNIT